MQSSLFIISCALALSLSAPGHTQQPGSESAQAGDSQSKPDMTEMFGPDYQKGDIGHSFGTIQSRDSERDVISIDHKVIHGTHIKAAITEFEILDGAQNADLPDGAQVEFLVKKGTDAVYRLLAICELGSDAGGCL